MHQFSGKLHKLRCRDIAFSRSLICLNAIDDNFILHTLLDPACWGAEVPLNTLMCAWLVVCALFGASPSLMRALYRVPCARL